MKKQLLIIVFAVLLLVFGAAVWEHAPTTTNNPARLHELHHILTFAEQKGGDYAADTLHYLVAYDWNKADLRQTWGTPYASAPDGQKDVWNLADKHRLSVHYSETGKITGIELQSEQTQMLPGEYDMNHNGIPETLALTHNPCSDEYTLSVLETGCKLWCGSANTSHVGWNSFFAVKHNGQDYLLQYNPYMNTGSAFYSYRLFSLDEDGDELVLQSDEVEFDVNFGSSLHQSFDTKRIADFLEEVHALLEDSQLLLSTENCKFLSGIHGTQFTADQFWLNDCIYDPEKSLEENLRIYKEHLTELRKD